MTFNKDSVCRILNSNLEVTHELTGHKLQVTCGCSNGSLVATGSRDYSTKIFDLETSKETQSYFCDRNMSTSMN